MICIQFQLKFQQFNSRPHIENNWYILIEIVILYPLNHRYSSITLVRTVTWTQCKLYSLIYVYREKNQLYMPTLKIYKRERIHMIQCKNQVIMKTKKMTNNFADFSSEFHQMFQWDELNYMRTIVRKPYSTPFSHKECKLLIYLNLIKGQCFIDRCTRSQISICNLILRFNNHACLWWLAWDITVIAIYSTHVSLSFLHEGIHVIYRYFFMKIKHMKTQKTLDINECDDEKITSCNFSEIDLVCFFQHKSRDFFCVVL